MSRAAAETGYAQEMKSSGPLQTTRTSTLPSCRCPTERDAVSNLGHCTSQRIHGGCVLSNDEAASREGLYGIHVDERPLSMCRTKKRFGRARTGSTAECCEGGSLP